MECYHHRSLAQKRVFTENPQGAPRCAESADLPLFGRYVNRIFTWEGATDIVSCWVFLYIAFGTPAACQSSSRNVHSSCGDDYPQPRCVA